MYYLDVLGMIKNEVLAYDVTLYSSSIQVPYFGEEIYRRKVARLPMNMPKVCVLQVPLYIIYFLKPKFPPWMSCCLQILIEFPHFTISLSV
jgi:hypothetical protein